MTAKQPRLPDGLQWHADGVVRCWWCGDDAEYVRYHDTEWGVPVRDDRRLFEKLSLEGFQAGLSWLTILRKRENFRRAFAKFDPAAIARFGARDIHRLLGDAGIVRHRGKIEAVINNARRYLTLVEEGGSLADLVWRYAPNPRSRPARVTRKTIPSETAESQALARELKRRGWRFVGPTTLYAFSQAMGLVNDHIHGCARR
ncbi:MAG: DNA-3-methyladenine glycosylase I [Gemmatimonadaceae bacterium]